jgi:hypothetical protein
MATSARTTLALAALAGVALVGIFLSLKGVPEVASTPTPTPLAPPIFEEGSPAGALHAYLEGDFAGDRLERASWAKYSQMVIWTSEPKWDGAYVVRSFRVESGKAHAHGAGAEATFDTIGELDLDHFSYSSSPSRQTVPYELVKGPDGWLIGTPTLRPHPGPEAAMAFLKRMEAGYPRQKSAIESAISKIDADARRAKP